MPAMVPALIGRGESLSCDTSASVGIELEDDEMPVGADELSEEVDELSNVVDELMDVETIIELDDSLLEIVLAGKSR